MMKTPLLESTARRTPAGRHLYSPSARLFAALTLGVLALGLGGCETRPVAESFAPPSLMSESDAMQAARKLQSVTPGGKLSRGSGTSMQEIYDEDTLLILEPVYWGNLRAGMTVAYKAPSGVIAVHRLIEHSSEDEWVAQGDHNAESDPCPVTPENLLGVVFGSIQASPT